MSLTREACFGAPVSSWWAVTLPPVAMSALIRSQQERMQASRYGRAKTLAITAPTGDPYPWIGRSVPRTYVDEEAR